MIIFINGASSSGKTSLARQLQAGWDAPLVYWSLDAVISQLPFHYTGAGSKAEQGFPLRKVDGVAEIGVGSIGRQMNQLSARYLKSVSMQEIDIVADFVLLDPDMLAPYVDELADQSVCFVGLDCSPGELERRNRQRPDRATGLSVRQQEKVHFCRAAYDLQLNSTRCDTHTLAAMVRAHLDDHPPKLGIG